MDERADPPTDLLLLPMAGEVERLVRARGAMFLVTTRQGDVTPAGARELGLFYQDTRFLSYYELEIRNCRAARLSAETSHPAYNQVDSMLSDPEHAGASRGSPRTSSTSAAVRSSTGVSSRRLSSRISCFALATWRSSFASAPTSPTSSRCAARGARSEAPRIGRASREPRSCSGTRVCAGGRTRPSCPSGPRPRTSGRTMPSSS